LNDTQTDTGWSQINLDIRLQTDTEEKIEIDDSMTRFREACSPRSSRKTRCIPT
jgi:hypothetical protein